MIDCKEKVFATKDLSDIDGKSRAHFSSNFIITSRLLTSGLE